MAGLLSTRGQKKGAKNNKSYRYLGLYNTLTKELRFEGAIRICGVTGKRAHLCHSGISIPTSGSLGYKG